MNNGSIGLYTNILVSSFSADISSNDKYTFIRTPKRADFFWGNYLVINPNIDKIDYHECISAFNNQVNIYNNLNAIAIMFDNNNNYNLDRFKSDGFNILKSDILVLDKPIMPNKFNSQIVIKEFDNKAWQSYVDVHYQDDWEYGTPAQQREFLKAESLSFKELVNNSYAKRYGGFLEGKLVADLGVIIKDDVVRFDNIATHIDYRRLGISQTLIYSVCIEMLQKYNAKKLVIEADQNYFAKDIYKAIGFKVVEEIVRLEKSIE